MKTGAILSEDRQYRYVLEREWDSKLPKVMFIGLNPSTADETQDDPTIKHCISFAKSWGYGGFYMTNLFAYRSTDPKRLWLEEDPVGQDNDNYILEYAELSEIVVACWGINGTFKARSKEVRVLLPDLMCLAITKGGEPRHPLYLKSDLIPRKL